MLDRKEYLTELKKRAQGHYFGWLDDGIRDFLIPKIPAWLTTYHFTWSSLLWGMLALLIGWLVRKNFVYNYLYAVIVIGQYVTDLLDGGIGRYRQKGLVLWGFYMDKMFDYIFMACMIISYFFFLGDQSIYAMMFAFVYSLFFLHQVMIEHLTGEMFYEVQGVGPTAIYVMLAVFHGLVALFGRMLMIRALQVVVIISLFMIGQVIIKSHHILYQKDIEAKET